MDYPVIPNDMLIKVIDCYGKILWCVDGEERTAQLIASSDELELNTRLIRVSIKKQPEHYDVASPQFHYHNDTGILLRRLLPADSGQLIPARMPRPIMVHCLCDVHNGKSYRHTWPASVRWLILK